MLVLQLLLMLLALHKAHPFPRSRIIMSPIAIKAGSIAARRTSLLHVQFLSKLCSPLSLSTRPEDATGTNIEANGSTAFIHSNEYRYSDKPKVVFVLGGPGAGKGTQCEMLSAEFGIKHLSAGELLREEQKRPTDNGRLIDTYLKEGKIVPVEISLGLLKESMEMLRRNRYLIDGFPRNMDNLNGWNRLMSDVCDVELIVVIDCDESELESRIISRGKTSGRSDDNLATIKKRFLTFKQDTMPVIDHFSGKNGVSSGYSAYPLVKVDGNRSAGVVYEAIKSAFLPCVKAEVVDKTQSLLNAIKAGDTVMVNGLCDHSNRPNVIGMELEHKILALMPAGIRSASFASPGTESKSPSSGCGTAGDYDAPTKIPPLSISNIEVKVEGKRATISFDLISDSLDIGDGNTGIGENISSPSGRLQWEWKLLDGGWRLQL